MNVTIYPEAEAWLFDDRKAGTLRGWSFGRHQPSADIGDDLLFRKDGVVQGRAIVRAIYKPGERNFPMFNGSRLLTGWKLLWYQRDFEDLRGKVPLKFGAPLSDRMLRMLDHRVKHDHWGGWMLSQINPLFVRGLIGDLLGAIEITAEGWRAVLRHVGPQRQMDMEHAAGMHHDDAGNVCRICGCTDNSGCDPDPKTGASCSWVNDTLCSRCQPYIQDP